jgi:hypothetical protein
MTTPPGCHIVQVEFSLLGLIPGHVGLRGLFAGVGDNRDTVKVPPHVMTAEHLDSCANIMPQEIEHVIFCAA